MPRGTPNARSNDAKNTPVLASKALESADQALGHTARSGDVAGATPEERVGEPELVQVAERMPDREQMEMLAFMAEPITVRIAQSTDKEAEKVFELTVNGRTELFRRGETKTVPRYFVDLMARLKVTSYETPEKVNEMGERYTDRVPFTALKYDFAVVRDDNPLGESWLKATLAQGG